MARRADWDNDDDFEIVNESSPVKTQQTFEFIDEDSFEIIPYKSKPTSLINTNPIPLVTIIEKPVPVPIKIGKPIVIEVKQSSENSSPPTNFKYLPIRCGSAAMIPYDGGFDMKSVLDHKPILFHENNDLMNILKHDKFSKRPSLNNNFQQVLIDNNRDRESLIQIAKQTQQDFIKAMQLD